MSALRFQELAVKRVSPEAAGAVAITFDIPPSDRERFTFEPGQFLTVRATIDGQEVRRTYSISSPRSRLARNGELEIGIRPVEGGLFSNWATRAIKAGDTLEVMPPDGRFVIKKKRAIHRVGFAAGSGITPILCIAASTLEEQPDSKFTLIYGNRRMSTVMFNEALQDLKDRFRDRLTMIHVLSRQAQEVDLLQGRIDGGKVRDIINTLLPVGSMDEVFICGPDEMITATENALVEAGVAADRIRTERFTVNLPAGAHPVGASSTAEAAAAATKDITMVLVLDGKEHEIAIGPDAMITATENALVEAGVPTDRIRTERFTVNLPAGAHPVGASSTAEAAAAATKDITMVLVLDGKEHEIAIGPDEHLLDAGLNAGLDLPFSCKAGVCCTCRAKVTEGEVVMDKNFTLEADEMAQGYVLSCQARATTKRLKISFDER